jgi:hypothetical protein
LMARAKNFLPSLYSIQCEKGHLTNKIKFSQHLQCVPAADAIEPLPARGGCSLVSADVHVIV